MKKKIVAIVIVIILISSTGGYLLFSNHEEESSNHNEESSNQNGRYWDDDYFSPIRQSGMFLKGDVDNDGDIDLTTLNTVTSEIITFLNNGVGEYNEVLNSSGVYCNDIKFGYLNNDNFLDIATAGDYILINNGDGSFTKKYMQLVDRTPEVIIVDDFNRDGYDDLVTKCRAGSDQYVRLHYNDGKGDFKNYSKKIFVFLGNDITEGESADVNQDMKPDAILNYGNLISIQINDENNDFVEDIIGYDKFGCHKLKFLNLVDLNNDNYIDIFVICGSQYGAAKDAFIYVSYNNGTYPLPEVEKIEFGNYTSGFREISDIVFFDYNKDNYIDFVFANESWINIYCYKNQSVYCKELQKNINGQDILALNADDLNNDGLSDIAVLQEDRLIILKRQEHGNFVSTEFRY
ncbi:MAG: VCBS repeat-containing protein [Thermoplasmata archaeon]|nr:MAG: VCBS repeat-containing protein [Thermoplasmata archaeon]